MMVRVSQRLWYDRVDQECRNTSLWQQQVAKGALFEPMQCNDVYVNIKVVTNVVERYCSVDK